MYTCMPSGATTAEAHSGCSTSAGGGALRRCRTSAAAQAAACCPQSPDSPLLRGSSSTLSDGMGEDAVALRAAREEAVAARAEVERMGEERVADGSAFSALLPSEPHGGHSDVGLP